MHAKTVGRLGGATFLALAFVGVNATAPLAVTQAAAPQARYAFDEQAVAGARKAAQQSLGPFFEFATSDTAAHAVPRVKVMIGEQAQWLVPLAQVAGGYTGALINEDNDAISGKSIEFISEQVVDWTFIGSDRRVFGSFQTRVRLAQLAPETAARLRSVLSETATPDTWSTGASDT